MGRSLIGAVTGAAAGVIFCGIYSGTGQTDPASKLVMVTGIGFGAIAGSVIGAAGAIIDAIKRSK